MIPELRQGDTDRMKIPPGEIGEELNTSLACILKHGPARATTGQEFSYGLAVKACERIGEVVVRDRLSEGLVYVRSEPAATVKERELTWHLDTMEKGERRDIRVWVKGERSGVFANCATLSVVPRVCVATTIAQPLLTILKTGPATARIGQDLSYTVTLGNKGDDVARSVVMTDTVPDGLRHSSGQRTLTTPVGDLAPGQTRAIVVPLRAEKRGRFCNLAAATAANTPAVKAEACTVVTEPLLQVAKSGPKEQFVGKTADYEIVVTNPGDAPVTNLTVTDTAPTAARIVAAPGANVNGNTATWKMVQLAAGAKQSYKFTLTSTIAGNLCNQVAASSAEGLAAKAEACTLWKGMAALLLEVVDSPDPILVGEATAYTIRVVNQGTANDTNIKITANFSKEIDPTSASGQTAGTVAGKSVTFAPVVTLAPQQSVTWTISAKGASAGDHRLKVLMNSDLLATPVTEEESTHVY